MVLMGLLAWNLLSKEGDAAWMSEREINATNNAAGNAVKAIRPTGSNAFGRAGDMAPLDNPGDPRSQLALWTKRLERAQFTFDNYRKITRYPHESRPAAEHGDQLYPNRPIIEEKRLYRPGGEPSGNIRLRTSQERIFVAGGESVLFTITAIDENDNPLVLTISAAGIVDPPKSGKPSVRKRLDVAFNDVGAEGDAAANDGTYSFRFTPAKQGFADFTGQLRLDMNIDAAGQSGVTYFDIYYTPAPPAIWTGAVRESIENGSLFVYLKADVRVPGRYVVSGRFEDFYGKPFAFAVFNEELATGLREVPLRAFGRLILDGQPTLPLRLRDIDGFLLKEDTSPDRALMPRLMGLVHMTKKYNREVFSDAEWQSEERDRYLREYLNDINAAKLKIDELNKLLTPPGKG